LPARPGPSGPSRLVSPELNHYRSPGARLRPSGPDPGRDPGRDGCARLHAARDVVPLQAATGDGAGVRYGPRVPPNDGVPDRILTVTAHPDDVDFGAAGSV